MTSPGAPIYFDANATTAVDPRVLEAMLPFFTVEFGNAESSQHRYGWKAHAAVERAREQVAQLLHAHANEIIFTSGSTESLYLALFGHLESQTAAREKIHLITSQAEHKATLEAFVRAKKQGHDVTFLPVNRFGQVEVEKLAAAIKPQTSFVSLMHANNEVGSMNPIQEIGELLKARGPITFHVDAAQTAGKHMIDVNHMKIDLLSLSAHKFHGPKGVGALYIRRPGVHLHAPMPGGGQERGLRGGTHNVPGIVGLGKACEIALDQMPSETARLTKLRDRLVQTFAFEGSRFQLNGHPTDRLCNNVHFTIDGIGLDQLLGDLAAFAFSTASACSGGASSHVLQAMRRLTEDPLSGNARFGLSRFTTEAEVDQLINALGRLH